MANLQQWTPKQSLKSDLCQCVVVGHPCCKLWIEMCLDGAVNGWRICQFSGVWQRKKVNKEPENDIALSRDRLNNFYCIVRGMASTKTVHEFIAIPPCMGWTMDECNQWPTENKLYKWFYCHIDLKLSFHKHPSIKQVWKWFQTILCSSKDLLPSGVAEVWRWSANDAEKKSDIKNKVLIYWRSKRSAKLLLYCCIVGLSWIWNKFSHCLSYTICGTLHAASSHIYWRFGFQRFYLFFYYYFQYNVRGRLLSISKESKWKKKKK